MARRNREASADFPYHITARCINRDWFGLEMSSVWKIMTEELYLISHVYGVRIHLFVLMNNHFHMIATFPENNMSKAMSILLKQTSVRITRPLGRINQTWGERFFSSRIDSYHYFCHAYKYTYRNPVEVGAANRVEAYPYSSLHGLLGFSRLEIPMLEDTLLFDQSVEETLSWLNKAPSEKARMDVKKALQKRIFKLPRDNRIERKINLLETNRY